ncbi:MAG: hypothetical protein CME70_04955 [Halobacteriovorax sp.]|nr:hypothetical protein [Halobacteriovorax sp.]
MKNILTTAFFTLFSASVMADAPKADIAILLDTSGSMQGLINQVRDGLWQTLNNLGEIKRDGKTAELRLALYEYGSGSVSAEANFLQILCPLTTDHTKIAEKLFATKATGSQEFSGAVISQATTDLAWATDHLDFKSIVIAGNETINQGPIRPLEAASTALGNNILVNTIFAGSQTIQTGGFGGGGFGGGGFGCSFCPNPRPTTPTEPPKPEFSKNPIFTEWENLAKSGQGETLNIDHNNSIPFIESPFDDRIVEITEEINKTFLPFGKDGQTEFDRMIDLDRNIRGSGAGSYIGWGSYRGGNFGNATNAKWDLVTAFKENPEFDLSKIKDEHLPEIMRGLTLLEKLKIVKEFTMKRDALEKESKELNEKRRLFVEEELRNRQGEDQQNFAEAFRKIIVKQLEAKGFEL